MLSIYRLTGRIIAVTLAACLATGTRAADAVYVSPKGNDANPGSAEHPFATLQKAVDVVSAREGAQEIILLEGVFTSGANIPARENAPSLVIRAERKPDGAFVDAIIDGGARIERATAVPQKPGVFTMPLKQAHPRHEYSVWEEDTRVRYRPMADLDTVARIPGTFRLTGEELYFHTSDSEAPEKHRIGVAHHPYGLSVNRANVVISGVQFRHFLLDRSSAGIRINAPNVTVEDCRAWNVRRAVTIGTDSANVRVIRLRADDVGNGVFSYGVNTVVEDCQFFRNPGPFEVQDYSQDQSGFQCYAPARGGEARRNLIVGFSLGLFFKCPASRFIAENNTVVGTGESAFGIGCTHWFKDSVFRYNVVADYRSALLAGINNEVVGTIEDNCFWQPEGGDRVLAKLAAEKIGLRNKNANPLFADVANGDYRLRAASPAAAMGPGAKPIGALGVQDAQPLYLPAPVADANLSAGLAVAPEGEIRVIAPAFVKRDGPPREWHVDPKHGADVPQAGTAQQPLKSLQLALNHANPGDRVVLHPGVYLGAHTLNHGGTEKAPIIIESSPEGGAILDGAKSAETCLRIENAPHVILRGLEVRWFMENGIQIAQSPHVQILNCVVWNNEWGVRRRIGTGISVADSRGVTIDRCVLYALDRGIIVTRTPAFRITRNTMTMCLHRGLWLIDSVAGSVLRNNSITFTGNENISVRAKPEELAMFDCDHNNFAAHIRSVSERRPMPEDDLKPEPGDFFQDKLAKGVAELNSERFFSLREWQEKTGKDKRSIFKHPRYADPQNRDFRLLPNSPNIGAGENGENIGALGVVMK